MKLTRLALLLICNALLAVAAFASTVYENGAINGEVDAATINFGFIVGDSFTVSNGSTAITGFSFGAWLIPGDTITSVEVWVNSQPALGGTLYFNDVVSLSQSGCSVNQYGYDVCTETASFNGPFLENGNYWLSLGNAVVPSGDPVYWDENGGVGCHSPGCPSQDWFNGEGTIPSEAFTVNGGEISTTTGMTPEPGSLLLFASGLLGLAGILRRKLL
ncbi:MAG: PEP-CTERM sorting domain-containing protein [Candidatus Korobacteraceae bacterium]